MMLYVSPSIAARQFLRKRPNVSNGTGNMRSLDVESRAKLSQGGSIGCRLTLYGTGMMANEVAQLEVADVLDERGEFRRQCEVRAEISFNGRARPVFWVNAKVCAALDSYFTERLKADHGVTAWRSKWRGLVQLGPVFLTNDGRPFAMTARRTSADNTSRSCESLTEVIRRLRSQAGIEAAGATSVRRTFGVRLKRDGYDLRHIREVLGRATLSAAKALCDGDPVDLGRIVAKVI